MGQEPSQHNTAAVLVIELSIFSEVILVSAID
jgi:hypothetical protein